MSAEFEIRDPLSDATPKQVAALKKFGAKVPEWLTKGDANEWLGRLISKSKFGPEINEMDLSGSPSFHKASELPREPPVAPTKPLVQATLPPVPMPPAPVSTAPVEESEPIPDGDGTEFITVESERVTTTDDEVNRVSVKITSNHRLPGETLAQTRDRLLRIASEGK